MLLIHGENTWASFERYKNLKQTCNEKGFDIVSIEGDEISDISTLTSNTDSLDMFGSRKVVFVKRLLSNRKTTIVKDTVDFLKKVNQQNLDIVFWEEKSVPKNLVYYKVFNETKKIEEFTLLKRFEMDKWARDQLHKTQIKFDGKDIRLFLEMVNYDQGIFMAELNKIKSIPNLETKSIKEIIGDNTSIQLWGFIDIFPSIIINGSIEQKNKLYKQFTKLTQNESEIMLHSLILRQVRLLIRSKMLLNDNLSQKDISSILKIPIFKINDFISSSLEFDLNDLVKLFTNLLIWEQNLKTGGSDYGFMLTLLSLN